MNVLSLFDGMSCGQIALNRAGIKYDKYYASEVDKYAIKVTQSNYPKTLQLGDINDWENWAIDWGNIDLIMAGSPCQSISNLGKKEGMKGSSGLFMVFNAILQHVKINNKNVKFILENVSGKKSSISYISEQVGLCPIVINSNDFSAQNRKRLYWTDINVSNFSIKNITLKSILEPGIPLESLLTSSRMKWLLSDNGIKTIKKRYASIDPNIAQCLTARSDASWNSNYVTRNGIITRLTPIEYERL